MASNHDHLLKLILTDKSSLTRSAGSVADGGMPPVTSAQAADGRAPSVVGNWSTSNVFGDIVNRSTGAFLMSSYRLLPVHTQACHDDWLRAAPEIR
jgi:hypothetical protein